MDVLQGETKRVNGSLLEGVRACIGKWRRSNKKKREGRTEKDQKMIEDR
jgi:hypothetical protein